MPTATRPSTNPLGSPAVIGLEGGRKLAEKRQRRKRRKQRVSSFVTISILLGVVAAAGYIGYTVYAEQQDADRIEQQQRQAELDAARSRRTTDELIDDLRETPRWNGPGAPAFGVGEGDAEIDAIVVTGP